MFSVQYREKDRTQQCEQFSSDRQTTHSNVQNSVQTDHTQQFVQFGTQVQSHKEIFTVRYRQKDHTQHFVQFNTERQKTHSNMQSSVMKDTPNTVICTVQDRKTDHNKADFSVQQSERGHTQQCVLFSTERKATHWNVYSLVQTEKSHTAMCKFQYRQSRHTANFFISIHRERQHKAIC